MAKTATRAAAPAPKNANPPRLATNRLVQANAADASSRAAGQATAKTKAQQAAEHQGRRAPRPEPELKKPATVPVTIKNNKPVQEYGSADQMPAFMRGDAGAGKEGIGREDIETPRLKLMQGLSPELQQYNDLKPGHFLHSASDTIFDAPFRAVPVYMERSYILWRPRDAGGGILARAADGIHWSPAEGEFEVQLDKKDGGAKVVWKLASTVQKSGLANWGTMDPNDPNSPPAATLMYNYVLAFPDMPDLMPAVLTFQRSAVKMGRRFNTKLKTVRTPLFGMIFEFSAVEDNNSRGQSFQNISVRGDGMVEDEAQYLNYKAMHESFKGSGLSIKDIDGLQTEDAGSNETDEDEPGKPKY